MYIHTVPCRELLLSSDGKGTSDLSSARVIGQERDGGVLFCWNKEGEQGVVTHVGWHLLNTKTFKTLYR